MSGKLKSKASQCRDSMKRKTEQKERKWRSVLFSTKHGCYTHELTAAEVQLPAQD